MRTALDDIKFLSNSAHRIRILVRLAESPENRETLHEETGISQPTLGRSLLGLQERGWITRGASGYQLTTSGRHLIGDFEKLESNVERYQKLQLVEDGLSSAPLDLEWERFADAGITTPSQEDPLLPIRAAARLLARAKTVRGMSPNVAFEPVEANWRAVVQDGQTVEMVVTPAVI